MRTFIFTILFAFPVLISAQDFEIYQKFDHLQSRLETGGDTLFVVNFWATWCKPCVAELPYFEAYHVKNEGKPIKVLLVSLDFKSQIEKRVKPFLEKKQMAAEVVLLADQDANTWISEVSEAWDGAIPATWIYQKGKEKFEQREFHSVEEIEAFVSKF